MGERSSGGSSSQITGSMARAYPESARIKPATHRRRGSRTVRPGVHDRGVEAAVAISTGEGARAAIADLRSGQRFEGRYACVRKDRLTARNGGVYLALELRDRTGTLPARVFREADRIGLRFERGDAVIVRGKLEHLLQARGGSGRQGHTRPPGGPARARVVLGVRRAVSLGIRRSSAAFHASNWRSTTST